MIFSTPAELLKHAAVDDTARKNRIRSLLRIRGLLLWGVLPVILFFFLFAILLAISLFIMIRGQIRPADFMKMTDIIFGAAAVLVLVTFTCLYFVRDADRAMRHLASLRDPDTDTKPRKTKTASRNSHEVPHDSGQDYAKLYLAPVTVSEESSTHLPSAF